MDELVDLQKQERKTARNREFRRKRGIINIEPKLSRAMNNLQKDGINKIVYEGLYTNEQEKKIKAKELLAAQNSIIPIAPQGLIANPGCLPWRMTEEEMQKYQQLREQNPLWNRFRISNDDVKEQAEYMQLIKQSEEKDNGKYDWFVSDEEDQSIKNNSTTATKNNELSSWDSSVEGRTTFKEKLSKIKSNLKGDESSVESTTGEQITKETIKLEEIDVAAFRKDQRNKQKEKVKQQIQLEALAKIHGVTIEEMKRLQDKDNNEELNKTVSKNTSKNQQLSKTNMDSKDTQKEALELKTEPKESLNTEAGNLTKEEIKNKEIKSEKVSSRNASQKKESELTITKDQKKTSESQTSNKDLKGTIKKEKENGSQKEKLIPTNEVKAEKDINSSQKKNRLLKRKSKSPEKKISEIIKKTSQEQKTNLTKKAEIKTIPKSPEKEKHEEGKKTKDLSKKKSSSIKGSVKGSQKQSQSLEQSKLISSSNHSVCKDIIQKSSLPKDPVPKELDFKSSSQTKNLVLKDEKDEDADMKSESHNTMSEKSASSPVKSKKGKKLKSSKKSGKKSGKKSATKKLNKDEDKISETPQKKRDIKAAVKNENELKSDISKAESEPKQAKSVSVIKKKTTRLNKFIETSEEIGKSKKKKQAKEEHQKVLEQIRRVSETNSMSRNSQSSRVTSDNEKQSREDSKRDEEMRKNREHRRMKMKRLIEKEQRYTKKKVVEPIVEQDPESITEKLNLPDCPERLRKALITKKSNKSPNVSQAKSESLSKTGKQSPIKGSGNLSKIQMIEAAFSKK